MTFCDLMGLSLSIEAYAEIKNNYQSKEDIRSLTKVFSADDFNFTPTIQYSNLIDLATGIHYLNEYKKYRKDGHMTGYASNSRRISYNRLTSALATWTNLNHPILPSQIQGLLLTMKTEISTEKKKREYSPMPPSKISSSTSSDSSDSWGKEKDNTGKNKISLMKKVEKTKASLWPRISRFHPPKLDESKTPAQIPLKQPHPRKSSLKGAPNSTSMSMGQWQRPAHDLKASSETSIHQESSSSENSSFPEPFSHPPSADKDTSRGQWSKKSYVRSESQSNSMDEEGNTTKSSPENSSASWRSSESN